MPRKKAVDKGAKKKVVRKPRKKKEVKDYERKSLFEVGTNLIVKKDYTYMWYGNIKKLKKGTILDYRGQLNHDDKHVLGVGYPSFNEELINEYFDIHGD